MAMDFPNSPAVGDKYPVSPSTGQPQYTWNGTLWTTHGVSPPGPGKVPVWTDGTAAMTAQLTLVGDPVNPTDAADKHYVDNIQPPAGSVRYDTAQTLTGGQQTQAQNNIGISASVPSGTVMLFYQAAAPIGWTKLTTQNDKAIRVVSGSGGVAGGTNPFSTVMAQTATGNHTLVKAEISGWHHIERRQYHRDVHRWQREPLCAVYFWLRLVWRLLLFLSIGASDANQRDIRADRLDLLHELRPI